MKNKLLITSALAAGSLMAGSIANAQTYYEKGNGYGQSTTTVGGDLALIYSAIQRKNNVLGNQTTGINSTRGFGRESQLNVSNRGKLNNGLDYAAGFSLEFDGRGYTGSATATENPSISNENVYVDLIAGNTTFTVGVDHIQRGYNGAVPAVFNITELMRAAGSKVCYVLGAKTSESEGLGVMQKFPSLGIVASAYYAPRSGDSGGEDVAAVTNGNSNSSYEIGFNGVDTFGVKGLTTTAFMNSMTKSTQAWAGAVKGVSWGAAYNFGQFAIGYDRFKNENGIGTEAVANVFGEQANPAVAITKKIGATYSVDSNLTFGYVRSTTDTSGSGINGLTETVNALQVGYNFGPVAVSGTVSKFNNLYSATTGPVDQDNGRMAQVRVTTKF
jgi:hypothetical protein